ncbi:MAG: response regulator transcription factor [Clostridia bacterium]|nr:response regulator transcription factor [Clostridia bacterium]
MEQTIYLADDDRNIRELMQTFLRQAGYTVETFPDGDALLKACGQKMPDLVILDIMMPGTDGLSVCSYLREKSEFLPIIIVSARDNPYDRVTGLSLGSDDYLIKPFLPLELVARVRALLRRSEHITEKETVEKLSFGGLTLSASQRKAELNGRTLPLTPTEFDFLAYMLRHQDQAISREEVLRELWKFDWEADTRAADDMLKRLRKKLKEYGGGVRVETVWGFGFRLVLED